MSHYRKPSPLEIIYAATDSNDASPYVINFFLEAEGDYNFAQWQQALKLTAEANPGMQLVMKGKWGFKSWDHGGPEPTLVELKTQWDGNSSEGACLAPINHRLGPSVQVLVMPGAGRIKALFRTHHAIADGQGAIYWLKDFFRALRGEPLEGSTGTYNAWTIAKSAQTPPAPKILGNCVVPLRPAKKPELQGMRWMRFTLPGNHQPVLPKLMIAIANIARRVNQGLGKTAFRIPSDLRFYTKDSPYSIANVTGSIDLEVTASMSVDSVKKMIKKSLCDREDLSAFPKNMGLVNWLPMNFFRIRPDRIAKAHAQVDYEMTGVISFLGNLGDLSAFSYEGFKATSFYVTPIPLEERAFSLTLILNDFKGLDAVVSVPNALASHDELASLCEEIKSEMQKLDAQQAARQRTTVPA